MKKYQSGVTLIELMVVVIIVSILMSIAIPSYRGYTVRAHRVDAQGTLMQMAAAQEKFYLANGQYCANADMSKALPEGLGIETKSAMGYYTFKVEDAMQDLSTGYFLSAAAVDGQLDSEEICKKLGINHRGVRYGGPDAVNKPATNEPKCWGNN